MTVLPCLSASIYPKPHSNFRQFFLFAVNLQKRKVLSLERKSEGVMDDESGESMEPMEEVPFIGLGKSELEIIA